MTSADLVAFLTWLVAQTGLTAITVKIGPMLDTPDQLIGIRPYTPPATPNWRADYRLQIRCRGRKPASGVSSWKDAYDLAEAVRVAVAPASDAVQTVALGGGKLAIMRVVGHSVPMGPDELGREEITVNVALDVSRV